MSVTTTKVWLGFAVLLVTTGRAGATDQLVPGTRLTLKVGSNGSDKLGFKAKGIFALPVPGSPDDPSQAGATLELSNPATATSFTFELPALHWSVTPGGPLYRYRDGALVESGKVRSGVLRGRSLGVSGRKVGIPLSALSQGALDIVLTAGSMRYCARFEGASVTRDQPGAFNAKNAPPPAACPGLPTTTLPTVTTSSTATTSMPTSTSLTATTSSTTTTLPAFCSPILPLLPLGRITFTTTPGATSCGVAPFSGEIDDRTGVNLRDLSLGCLQIGAGKNGSLPAAPLTDGSTTVLDVSGINALALTLAGSDGSGPADCSKGPGPGGHCSNGSTGTDGNGACRSDGDCGGDPAACTLDPNCYFGPPLPVSAGALSTCALNVFAADACGAADLGTRQSTLFVALSSRLYLTSNAASPCPQCIDGTCTAGQRAGLPCSGGVGSKHTTLECPPSPNQFLAALPLTLSPLTTGASTATDPAGLFCPGQVTPGAFGLQRVRTIHQTGSPLLGGPSLFSMTVAGNFCVPSSGVGLIDAVVDLPGPGSVSVSGTAAVCLLGLLCP